MKITPDTVEREREWARERAPAVASLINEVRGSLGDLFGVPVGTVTEQDVRDEVAVVFADGKRAVNVAALIAILRELDVVEDYPGFIVDEVLGRELAGVIAGEQPFRLLGEATFHYADVLTHTDGTAGEDDLDAALAAGFQTRLPGWEWVQTESPFDATDE